MCATWGMPSVNICLTNMSMQVITVGSFEGEVKGTDGQMYKAAGRRFGETRDCWQYLDYLTMHKYHVTDFEDIELSKSAKKRRNSKGKVTTAPTTGWPQEEVRVRDAHVRVRLEKLLQVVELATGNLTRSTGVFQWW